MTHKIYTPENMAALNKLADQPFTEKTILRRGPPVCPLCGTPAGGCAHTGGVEAAAIIVEGY